MTSAMTILLAAVLSTASLAAPSSDPDAKLASQAHDTHQAHNPPHDTTLAPPAGERWPTDEALRTGMSRIEAAVAQTTTTRPLSRERAQELARTVEQNVTYIVEHCNLPPQPDAALHVLIAQMMAAANQLKKDASSEAAVAQLLSALDHYRDTFDHSPPDAPHRH